MKKKFKDTKLGKFLIGEKGVFKTLANTIPDKGLLGVLKGLIVNDKQLTPKDKETALKLLEMDLAEMQEVSERWKADMGSDSWLSKNTRPLVLIYLDLCNDSIHSNRLSDKLGYSQFLDRLT